MNISEHALWKQFFGEVWETLIKSDNRTGAFLLRKSDGLTLLDENAMRILDLKHTPDCERMLHILHIIEVNIKSGAPLHLHYLPEMDGCTAGFFRLDVDPEHANAPDISRKFFMLLEQNLFFYHYQPIVNARTGEIVAYESLMRTDRNIGLTPVQILDIASDFNRLYDIEKATMRNNFTYLKEHRKLFHNRRLFINSIPSHMLNEKDFREICEEFYDLFEHIVVEFTEQTEITDDSLACILERLTCNGIQLAIDDYGTGYSNTSNLLRYNPDIVKIDHSLIASIDTNHKTRKIVSGIIDFLHNSGYTALAEGVETSAELRVMIELGVDLIQGYYVARPAPVLLEHIPDEIRDEIVQFNLEVSDQTQRVYRPRQHETVDLRKLAAEHYSDILLEVSSITLIGEKNLPVCLPVTVKDGTDCTITMIDADIVSLSALAALRIGDNCHVCLVCEGNNKFEQKGIFIPLSSSLRLEGDGSLSIFSEHLDCCGIGTDSLTSYGAITVALNGRLDITVNGEKCVGIGGGKNTGNHPIRLLSGDVYINCNGTNSLAVGCRTGNSMISIKGCALHTHLLSATCVGVGALRGSVDVQMEDFHYECVASGLNLTAVGALENGSGQMLISRGKVGATLKGKQLTCIGTTNGAIDTDLLCSKVVLYCEGNSACGIGDMAGGGNVAITNSELVLTFLSAATRSFGTEHGKLTITGGMRTVHINE